MNFREFGHVMFFQDDSQLAVRNIRSHWRRPRCLADTDNVRETKRTPGQCGQTRNEFGFIDKTLRLKQRPFRFHGNGHTGMRDEIISTVRKLLSPLIETSDTFIS
jgi:hypothetical protein